MNSQRVKFSEVPVGGEIYCYWDGKNPKDFDTFRATKVSDTHIHAPGQFDHLEMHPDEPCRLRNPA